MLKVKDYSLFILTVLFSCSYEQNKEIKDELFSLLPANKTNIYFNNEVSDRPDINIFLYRNFYNGGGVGIGDINNDGLPDIYMTSNLGSNKLYLNRGGLKFEDITELSGTAGSKAWTTGISIIDVNSDGYLDLYVSNAGNNQGDDHKNELFINNGDLTFTEKASDYGLDDSGYTTHTAFFDYDQDGDLDAYILNNSFVPVNSLNYSGRRDLYAEDWPVSSFLKGGGDKLLRNDNGFFNDVTKESGILGSLIGFGLGVTVGDINDDSFLDIYVSNDFFERDYLYINQQDGTFSEEIMDFVGHLSLSSMGADMSDLNNDGYPEIFVTEMLPNEDERIKTTSSFELYNLYQLKQSRGFYNQYMHNTLQLNNGNGSFSEIGWYSGVAATDWSWGALMFDVDNDGKKDLYVSNGIQRDVTNQDFIAFFANEVIQKMVLSGEKEEFQTIVEKMPSNPIPNKLYMNGENLKFKDASLSGLIPNIPSCSNGSAYADLDNDGDYDLVVNNVNQEAFVFQNNAEKLEHHYIALKLVGSGLNPFAIGSKVKVFIGENVFYHELIPTRGFQSSVDYKILLGLGKNTRIDSLTVKWPDQRLSRLYDLPVDTVLTLKDQDAVKVSNSSSETTPPMFTTVNHSLETLVEDNYVDFYQEGLVIKMLSKEGPKFDVADLNGDGLDDIVIGGPANSQALVYFQDRQGFSKQSQEIFERSAIYEDTYVKLIDLDGDSDIDMYAGSGGNFSEKPNDFFEDRIYLNDGKGNFTYAKDALPKRYFNTSVVLPININGDELPDLFVGSRSVPGNYGRGPSSFILRNEGNGKFKDMTSRYLPELRDLGMITDAVYADVVGDDVPELIIVGEWMSPMVYSFDNGRFEKTNTKLDQLSGWWNAIASDDIDNDGDVDLVLGNRGENFYFSASVDQPVRLWLSDFDKNGTEDKIITRFIDGKHKPVYTKNELASQLNFIKKNNLKNSDYASQGMADLFSEKTLSSTDYREAVWFKSIVAVNNGDALFELKELPKEVQFSCVNDILLSDVNSDGNKDLILIGNESSFLPQFSRLDASYGHLLLNDGSGEFEWIPNKYSGIFLKGDSKQISNISINNEDHLLITRNQEAPVLLKKY